MEKVEKRNYGKWHLDYWKLLSLILMIILAIFLLYPLITICYKSVFNGDGQLSFGNYVDFFTLKYYTSALAIAFWYVVSQP